MNAATDPSHFAFYLRGQGIDTRNLQAAMALPPCKDQGQSCSSGSDCCQGQCVKDGNNNGRKCGPPGMRAAEGNACNTAQDCCGLSPCVDGYCQAIPPK